MRHGSAPSDMARRIVQALCVLCVALTGAASLTVTLLQRAKDMPTYACATTALYPVERLAARGDVGAMAYLSTRARADGCDARARARGLAYLAQMSETHPAMAGPETAQEAPDQPCAALLAMMLPGVEDPQMVIGVCDTP